MEVGSRGLIDTTDLFELGTVLRFLTREPLSCLLASLEHQSWSHTKYSAVETFILLSPIPTLLPLSVYISFVTQFLLWCSVSYVLAILRRCIPPNKEVNQQTIPSLLYTRIVQNATGERLGYKGQLSMEKCCSQMAKVRRTLHSHSLTPLSILSLPLSPSPTLLSLSFFLSFFSTSSLFSVCGETQWNAER